MSGKTYNIFLTDDDYDDRQLFEEAINDIGINIVFKSFENGVDLMKNLLDAEIQLPDCIFLDLNMPMMNGEECLNDIRLESKFTQIPVIIYSTLIDSKKVLELQSKGADLYLKKPNAFDQLKLALTKCIEFIDFKFCQEVSSNNFVLKY